MIVLDTNVLSEALKPAPSDIVMQWLATQDPAEVFITAVTQAEILYGIEAMPAGKRRTRLYVATEKLFSEEFQGRILPFNEESARLFATVVSGRRVLGRPISQ